MPLDDDMKAIIDLMDAGDVLSIETLGVEALRAGMLAALPTGEPEAVDRVENRTFPGPEGPVPVRIYGPAATEPCPALVYFHGGGWVLGNLDTHDSTCRALSRRTACVVVSVDYRLAPEHTFPAALDDCIAAVEWVADNAAELGVDPTRIAVGGDSAGGNLTATVTLANRSRRGLELCHQLLIYPVTDARRNTPSYKQNAEGYLLTADAMRWFWDLYLNEQSEGANPLASPLRAEDLAGLPPATVITAEFDPLRDEGEAYAEQLAAASVPVDSRRWDGVAHGFFAMEGSVAKAKEALDWAAAQLQKSFARN